jgi:NADPH-dependent curcumin reductase CurA
MWELDAASGEADERAGGVGGLAVQLARTRGAYVIGTASTGNVLEHLPILAPEVSLCVDSLRDH